MWEDQDEVKVKPEPISDDEMGDSEQIGLDAPAVEPAAAVEKTEPVSPTTERKLAPRPRAPEPVLQTDEDRAEWARFQSNRQHIRAELGPDTTPVDAAGDAAMADADAATNVPRPTVRDNNVYLFQIPPLMPQLVSDAEPLAAPVSPPAPAPKKDAKDTKIKTEESFSDPAALPAAGPRFASGRVGKLRVHASGRTTLDWGGTSYELAPGAKASFLQEVVAVHVVPEAERVVEEDAGEAVSFGRVKGKFVVVPDWGDMLG